MTCRHFLKFQMMMYKSTRKKFFNGENTLPISFSALKYLIKPLITIFSRNILTPCIIVIQNYQLVYQLFYLITIIVKILGYIHSLRHQISNQFQVIRLFDPVYWHLLTICIQTVLPDLSFTLMMIHYLDGIHITSLKLLLKFSTIPVNLLKFIVRSTPITPSDRQRL